MGYRLTLIETGQVAQNLSLAAIELGIGSCEFGGVLGAPFSQELNLDENVKPLLGLAFGYESKDDRGDLDLTELANKFIGQGKPIISAGSAIYKDSSFFGAFAKISKNEFTGATSTSSAFARAKAIIEGYERIRSGVVANNSITYCNAQELDRSGALWLDPRIICSLNDEQISKNNLVKFNELKPIHWRAGHVKGSDSTIMVPSDLIYYGGTYPSVSDHIAFSNSSGVAAFTDYSTAEENAELELIERDALMRTWFSRISPDEISPNLLTVHLQHRKNFWSKFGRRVHFYIYPVNLPMSSR